MDSKRLPGKSLRELAGRPLLEHVIERSKAIEGVQQVVVATGDAAANAPILDLAASSGVEAFCGSDHDVLERYVQAAELYGADYVVRVTGDNPFTDVEYAGMAVEIATESGADLTSMSGLPLGCAVEVIKTEALLQAHSEGSTAYHREHVTPYIKEHDEIFRIERHPVETYAPYAHIRLTVDTPEDYELASILYKELFIPGKMTWFPLKWVIDYLLEFPQLADINQNIQHVR
jgi:spore coat polysaccharide biosynthesis protein SpsF